MSCNCKMSEDCRCPDYPAWCKFCEKRLAKIDYKSIPACIACVAMYEPKPDRSPSQTRVKVRELRARELQDHLNLTKKLK